MTHYMNDNTQQIIRHAGGTLQIFELKQLADIEADYKSQCRAAFRRYRDWKKTHTDETDMISLLYGNVEGIMLRRFVEESVRAYWTIRQDFRYLFQQYLDQSCAYYVGAQR